MHILEQLFLRRNAQVRHVFVATFSPLVLVIVDGSFSLQFDSARICSQLTQMCRLFMNDSLAQKLTNFPGSLEQQQKIVKLHSNLNILSVDESTFHFQISKKYRQQNNKQKVKFSILQSSSYAICPSGSTALHKPFLFCQKLIYCHNYTMSKYAPYANLHRTICRYAAMLSDHLSHRPLPCDCAAACGASECRTDVRPGSACYEHRGTELRHRHPHSPVPVACSVPAIVSLVWFNQLPRCRFPFKCQ